MLVKNNKKITNALVKTGWFLTILSVTFIVTKSVCKMTLAAHTV